MEVNSMSETSFSDIMERTVAWSDGDAAGITYYAKNFEWFTDAYMKLLDKYGFSYMETFHERGLALVCLKADCEYKKMVRPLEKITIHTKLASLSRTRVLFMYQIYNQKGELTAIGRTAHAFVNDRKRPVNLQKSHPTLWRALHEKMPEQRR
jgi:acyl-CoA thioester hydrolase